MSHFSPLLWLCAVSAAALNSFTALDPTGAYEQYLDALGENTPAIAAFFDAAESGVFPWTIPGVSEPIPSPVPDLLPQPPEVNITFTDDEKIREMNNQFRHIDAATDVLSFPLGENGEYDINPDTGCKQLGDIVISVEHAVAQANEFGHTFEREMGYLTVHSMLHLLGYDHVNGGLEKTIMREKEEEALGRLGLTRDNTYVE